MTLGQDADFSTAESFAHRDQQTLGWGCSQMGVWLLLVLVLEAPDLLSYPCIFGANLAV